MGIAGQSSDARLVNSLEHAGAGCGKLRLRERRGGGGEESSDSRQSRQQCSRDPRHWFDSCRSDGEAESFLAGKIGAIGGRNDSVVIPGASQEDCARNCILRMGFPLTEKAAQYRAALPLQRIVMEL